MPLFEKKEDLYEFINKFENSNANEIEVETPELKIKIKKQPDYSFIKSTAAPSVPNISNDILIDNFDGVDEMNININTPEPKKLKAENERLVKAPFIGVYYSAPSPQSDDFVYVGKKVKKGDILCIIEAMKVMNDIECEHDGEITEIYKKNTEAVEYNCDLFKIKI